MGSTGHNCLERDLGIAVKSAIDLPPHSADNYGPFVVLISGHGALANMHGRTAPVKRKTGHNLRGSYACQTLTSVLRRPWIQYAHEHVDSRTPANSSRVSESAVLQVTTSSERPSTRTTASRTRRSICMHSTLSDPARPDTWLTPSQRTARGRGDALNAAKSS